MRIDLRSLTKKGMPNDRVQNLDKEENGLGAKTVVEYEFEN